ncbi:MAG: twitching motility protein PilT [Phycisphaerae bacterium]|nr:twitching motility protein PilT [Phycisphaerae bacterium]MBM93065.1 twitching motility protein PilT [Phycisphaerae bacterium]HCT43939.1 twitching motility protein PilT [Phycisphaerales bacterium]|tara:strand:- start:356 stop:1495 length:1140 start_codon:yes stop_codon:yes gene_type:complete
MLRGALNIKKLLGSMARLDASDLHIKVGIPPTYRIGGELRPIEADAVTEDEADHLLDPLLSEVQKRKYEESGDLDFAWHIEDPKGGPGDRFRINMLRSGNHTHAAIRRVKAEIPSYEDLHLPKVYSDIVHRERDGLVLVVGVTGSGKSSTLAAMINEINAKRAVNIITIEDPVEYRFTPKQSIISQREIGIDVTDFHEALRHVVRQDPDVIFIGEMRDQETVLSAIQAAETGHLVFATLHTSDTMGAFGRMLEFFPQDERSFVRNSLAGTLKAICAQRLVPANEGQIGTKVVPAVEVLLTSPTVRELIRDERDSDLPSVIASSREDGMVLFTHYFAELVNKEWITMQTAKEYAPNKDMLSSILKGVEVKAGNLVGRIKG